MRFKVIGSMLLVTAGVLLFYKAPMGGPLVAVLSGGMVVFGLLGLGRAASSKD